MRVLKIAAAIALVLVLAACARASIEEIGRTAIRERAAEGKNWFARFSAATDTSDKELVTSKLKDQSDPYTFGWDSEGDFYTEHYYREHITTSGGFWGEQRTVSACVRFEVNLGAVSAASVQCPNRPPFSDYTDERVMVA